MGTKVTTIVRERYGKAALSILSGEPKAAC
jgi:hypothetical protein